MAMPTGLVRSVSVIVAGLVPTLAARVETRLPTVPEGAEVSSVWEIIRTGDASSTGALFVPVIVITTVTVLAAA